MNDIEELLKLSPPVILVLCLNILGVGLKKTPMLPNWIIPIILSLTGLVVYPYIAETGSVAFQVRNPDVLLAVYGFALGAASVGLHQVFRQIFGRLIEGPDEKKPTTPNEETK